MPKSNPLESLDASLGILLVNKGIVSAEEVEYACGMVAARKSVGFALAQALVENGAITVRQAERFTAECLSCAKPFDATEQLPGYQVMEKLGAGAMATVYKARQISLDRPVAIKILPRKHSKDAAFIKRFYDEGKAAAQLNHPNIVQAFDVGHAGEHYYFVMEYVDGWTVHDEIIKDGKYQEKRAIQVAIDVVKALAHAHEMGFVHRDVKPKNIMITKTGQAKLADMGLARAISDREAAESEKGKAFGTPYYISPEQIQGAVHIDHRADIYSFGATLYHMVTGRVPFEGNSPTAVMYRHLRDELVPVDLVNPMLSQGISEIIEVCMAKSPENRYACAEDLLADLQAVEHGDPPHIARKNFDVASFAKLDASLHQAGEMRQAPPGAIRMVDQPFFWPMVGSYVLAAAMLVAMVVILIFR